MRFDTEPNLVVSKDGIYYDMKIKINFKDFYKENNSWVASSKLIDSKGNEVMIYLRYYSSDLKLLKNVSNARIQFKKWSRCWILSINNILISKVKNFHRTGYDKLKDLEYGMSAMNSNLEYSIKINVLKDNYIQTNWLATQEGLKDVTRKLSIKSIGNVNYTYNNSNRPFQGGRVSPR